jgi:RNA polymerase sigma-70 factor (ECF subfamily)
MATAGIPLRRPEAADLPDRLGVMLKVVYLLFTEGYRATAGADLHRPRLAAEAIRLGYLLGELLPGEEAIVGLLALMLLQHARRDARVDAGGRLVGLPNQDRGKWRHDEIDRGLQLLAQLGDELPADRPPAAEPAARARDEPAADRPAGDQLAAGRPAADERAAGKAAADEYHLQALIAAEHSTGGETDWPRIARLYAELERRTGSPVVRLNRAVAVAEAGSPEAALALVDGLDQTLPANHLVPTVRAELLVKLGRGPEAQDAYDEALKLVRTDAERDHLQRRRAEI